MSSSHKYVSCSTEWVSSSPAKRPQLLDHSGPLHNSSLSIKQQKANYKEALQKNYKQKLH